jgi:hypothetical protein
VDAAPVPDQDTLRRQVAEEGARWLWATDERDAQSLVADRMKRGGAERIGDVQSPVPLAVGERFLPPRERLAATEPEPRIRQLPFPLDPFDRRRFDPLGDPIHPHRNVDGDVVSGRNPAGITGVVARTDGHAGYLVRPRAVTRQQIGEEFLHAGAVERVEQPDAVGRAEGVAGAATVLVGVSDPGDAVGESVDRADGLWG